ncbi:MAG TPA: hypothetical protein VMC85_01220 [Desulfomonilaceae bacterium]|nr:hypothetical protein [Desulfomonilaceae bacterium]
MKVAIDPPEAIEVMEEANRIIQDFSTLKQGLYAVLFIAEVALCFWIAAKL